MKQTHGAVLNYNNTRLASTFARSSGKSVNPDNTQIDVCISEHMCMHTNILYKPYVKID